MTEQYIQMLAALGGVVLLIILFGYLMKKRQIRSGVLINVVSYHPFGPRKGVAALKMGREVLLLGITQNDIKLLKAFNENDFEEKTTAEINTKIRMLKNMKERLNESK